jgi:hypothetical protein
MARRQAPSSQPSSQWVYLARFFVGRTGDLGCQVRDISSGDAWVEADPERARAALDAIEKTRPRRAAKP